MNKGKVNDGGFFYSIFEYLINFLFFSTFFELIKRFFRIKRIRTFADIYVCIMFILSVVLSTFSRHIGNVVLLNFILVGIVYRIFEITITLIYNFFVSEQTENEQSDYRIFSVKRCILLFLLNVFEIVNHFITIYIVFGILRKISYIPTYFELFKGSALAFITQNSDMINEFFLEFSNISFIQCLLGYFYSVILLAMLIGNAPKIKSLSEK